jgi:hypothetical protein
MQNSNMTVRHYDASECWYILHFITSTFWQFGTVTRRHLEIRHFDVRHVCILHVGIRHRHVAPLYNGIVFACGDYGLQDGVSDCKIASCISSTAHLQCMYWISTYVSIDTYREKKIMDWWSGAYLKGLTTPRDPVEVPKRRKSRVAKEVAHLNDRVQKGPRRDDGPEVQKVLNLWRSMLPWMEHLDSLYITGQL